MKSKIKKRVDDDKHKSSSLVFLLALFFILLISIGALYLYKDNLIELFEKDKETVKEKIEKKSNVTKIDVNSPNIQHLFTLVHSDFYEIDSTIYKNKKLDVSSMEDYYKFSLASNLYSGAAIRISNATINEVTAYIQEEQVKNYYEIIFGKDTYKKIDVIPYMCTNMNYDSVNRRYVTTNQVCGSVSPFGSYEKVIDAKKEDDLLYITGAVIFTERYTGSICKDYECKNVIDNYPSNIYEKEYFYEYIDKNKNNLIQYTYKFKLNNDGFYYYQGFERTKE